MKTEVVKVAVLVPENPCICNCGTDLKPHICRHEWSPHLTSDERGVYYSVCTICGITTLAHNLMKYK